MHACACAGFYHVSHVPRRVQQLLLVALPAGTSLFFAFTRGLCGNCVGVDDDDDGGGGGSDSGGSGRGGVDVGVCHNTTSFNQ